jgi:hypothetical protein
LRILAKTVSRGHSDFADKEKKLLREFNRLKKEESEGDGRDQERF